MRSLIATALIAYTVFLAYAFYQWGVEDGKKEQTVRPEGNCVIYPDGGKRCFKEPPTYLVPFEECSRVCRQKLRSL